MPQVGTLLEFSAQLREDRQVLEREHPSPNLLRDMPRQRNWNRRDLYRTLDSEEMPKLFLDGFVLLEPGVEREDCSEQQPVSLEEPLAPEVEDAPRHSTEQPPRPVVVQIDVAQHLPARKHPPSASLDHRGAESEAFVWVVDCLRHVLRDVDLAAVWRLLGIQVDRAHEGEGEGVHRVVVEGVDLVELAEHGVQQRPADSNVPELLTNLVDAGLVLLGGVHFVFKLRGRRLGLFQAFDQHDIFGDAPFCIRQLFQHGVLQVHQPLLEVCLLVDQQHTLVLELASLLLHNDRQQLLDQAGRRHAEVDERAFCLKLRREVRVAELRDKKQPELRIIFHLFVANDHIRRVP
eukprot:3935223-Rhodomonas_salina.1